MRQALRSTYAGVSQAAYLGMGLIQAPFLILVLGYAELRE